MLLQQPENNQRSTADTSFTNPVLPLRMLTMSQVEDKVGLGRTKIYEMMASGEFPQSVQIGGGRAMRFIEGDIDQWLLDQIQKSRTKPRTQTKVCVKRPAKVSAKLSAKGDSK